MPASERAYAVIGAGGNIIWIEPEHDLILIACWVDPGSVNGLIAHVTEAITL